jgi:mannose-1-phosphate guanylyltransferase
MKIIIFAGGTGKRFWPASRKKSPKQFQSVIDSKPLIQLKYDYLRIKFNPEDIFVSTGIQYKNEIENILPEIPKGNFIYEPAMIDNGAAVALAVSYVKSKYPNEIISIQWSDHYIKNPKVFAEALVEGEKLARDEKKMVIIGVPARYPSPNRGYINFGKKLKTVGSNNDIILYEFRKFVEKPTVEIAKDYISSKEYLWNPGYFISDPNYVLEKYKKFAPEIYACVTEIAENNFSQESLEKYKELPRVAFDYVFSENLSETEAFVLSVEMGWNDVGEWVSLKEALEKSPAENVTVGNVLDMGSSNSLIYNYQDKKLVSTINLKDMIVINTEDVIAVFHKDDNGALKEYLKLMENKGYTDYL